MDILTLMNVPGIQNFDYEIYKESIAYVVNEKLITDREKRATFALFMDNMFSLELSKAQQRFVWRNYMAPILSDHVRKAKQKGEKIGIVKGEKNTLLNLVQSHLKDGTPPDEIPKILYITKKKFVELKKILDNNDDRA
jgi:hypothetical protein